MIFYTNPLQQYTKVDGVFYTEVFKFCLPYIFCGPITYIPFHFYLFIFLDEKEIEMIINDNDISIMIIEIRNNEIFIWQLHRAIIFLSVLTN